jgi:hypothetical protein
MPQLQKPTVELVNRYIQKFAEGVGIFDKALTVLFRTFPENAQLEHVLLKVTALNSLYYTNIWAVTPVAENILRHNIDEKLAQEDPELVNQIAVIKVKGKTRRNYSFASKYCSWHMPEAYPIFDSFVNAVIWKYQQVDRFSNFRRYDLHDYPTYKRILEEFKTSYGLGQYSFKDLDKFLWQYGKENFA